jgi:hypothetical protein
MERRLLKAIRRLLRKLGRRRINRRFLYTDATVVEVYLWAVLNDRPTFWACDPGHWAGVAPPPGFPSPSQMSRRLRTPTVRRLIDRVEAYLLRRNKTSTLACAIDGHAMEIAPHSADKQAGYGRARRGNAKGYKLHVLLGLDGTLWSWRVTPMNTDERTMALRMTPQLPPTCYLVADTNYDSNRLFHAVGARGVQLVAPRRVHNPGQGLGHRKHDPARLRCIDMLENTVSDFGRLLLAMRGRIEGFFGTLTCHANGLHVLMPWVRTYRRVRLWVQAKLIINQLRADLRATNPAG